jgi:hypothetical protein
MGMLPPFPLEAPRSRDGAAGTSTAITDLRMAGSVSMPACGPWSMISGTWVNGTAGRHARRANDTQQPVIQQPKATLGSAFPFAQEATHTGER